MKKRIKEFIFLFVFGLIAVLVIYGINSGLGRIVGYKNSKLTDIIDEILPIGLVVYISLVYFRPVPEGFTLRTRKKKLAFRIGLAMLVLILLKYFATFLN